MTTPLPPTIPPAPTPAPTRADPANFRERGDAYHTWLPPFVNETLPEVLEWMTDRNGEVLTASQSAEAAAAQAQSAASSAAAALDASVWVDGTFYLDGQAVWSPTTYLTYRKKGDDVSTTDPALDDENWAQIAGPSGVALEGDLQTFVGSVKTFQITNYSSFSTYSVLADQGEISIDLDVITYTAPFNSGVITFVVVRDGAANTFKLDVQAAGIATPSITFPASGAVDVGSSVTVTASAFEPIGNTDTHATSDWQLSTDSLFATVVQVSTASATDLTQWAITGLTESTDYYVRVRYNGASNGASNYSAASSFTTAASFGPSVFGEPYGGGYYAGKIVEGGSTYILIIAPKASGESSSKQWKTANTAGPSATRTLNNGPAASASMNSSTYPAAQFCENLSIGGFTDWYLPSRDELELCFRNFKSTSDPNYTANRPKSTYVYPEGDDLAADTMGVNRNSDPIGAAYTATDPAQTTAVAFQSGGPEAFTEARYWSSSEYSDSLAWAQTWFFSSPGFQFTPSKSGNRRVRAARRSII